MRIVSLVNKDLKDNFKSNSNIGLGIGISVFLVCTMLLISLSFNRQMTEEMRVANDDVVTIAFGNKEETLNYTYLPILNDDILKDIGKIGEVDSVSGVKIIQTDKISTESKELLLRNYIFGLDSSYFDIQRMKMSVGEFPKNGNELVVGDTIAKSRGLKVGGTIFVEHGGKEKKFVVSGIIEKQKQRAYSTSQTEVNNMLATSIDNDMFSNTNYSFMVSRLKDSSMLDVIANEIEAKANKNDEVSKQLKNTGDSVIVISKTDIIKMINGWFVYINIFIIIISVIASMVSAVNIINILMLRLQNRMKDIAIMRVVGSNRKQIIFYFIYQVVVLGVVSSFISIICSTIITKIISYAINWPFEFNIFTILLSFGVGIFISLISSIIISSKISKVDLSYALSK